MPIERTQTFATAAARAPRSTLTRRQFGLSTMAALMLPGCGGGDGDSVDQAAMAKVDALIQQDIDAGRHFGAALLVARGGKVIHRAYLGTVAPGRNTAQGDKYLQMSMSKAYTAVLVLQAIDAGRFTLDTRVADLVPAFAVGGKEASTIRQLLCHTSGLPTAPVAPPLPLTAMGQLALHAEAICALEAVYAPGTRCAYTSGTGYDMLGQILVLTDPKGRSFQQIAQQDLFGPLGMVNTSFGLATDDPKRVPVSFTPSATTPASAPQMLAFNQVLDANAEYPCAGAFGDLDDVFTFTEALAGRGPKGYQLVSPKLLAEARLNATGEMPLEVLAPVGTPPVIQAPEDLYPARFTLMGGYTRGTGAGFSPAGATASASALVAVGGGSTGWMYDPARDLSVVFLSSGLVEGVAHPQRLAKVNDAVIAALS